YPAPIRIPTCISHSPSLRVLAARGFSRHARRAAQYPIRSSSGPLAIDDRDRTPRLPGALYHPGTRPGHLCRATDPLGTGGWGEDPRGQEQERGGLRYRGRHEALTGPALGECVRPGDRVAGRGDSFHARREGARHVDRLELVGASLQEEALLGPALREHVRPRD